MKYDPTLAAIDLAAQLIAYHGHTYEEVADITVVRDHKPQVEARVAELEIKKHKDPTRRRYRYSTTERIIRKLNRLDT